MKTKLIKTSLEGLLVVEVDYFKDERGFFVEPWNKRDFNDAGLDIDFVQEGHSRSKSRVLRGLHYQNQTAPMGKLVRCTLGKIFDVAVDIRSTSRSFGKWFGVNLDSENKKQLYVPPGYAHGFVTLSEFAEVQYKQTGYYAPSSEGTIVWNDVDIGIKWPVVDPILSERDKNGIFFKDYMKQPAF